MSRHIPVAPDRWAEMVQASAEVGPLRNKVSDLKTELAIKDVEIDRLRAQVEWLRKADRLVCWNAETQEWEVRHEALK